VRPRVYRGRNETEGALSRVGGSKDRNQRSGFSGLTSNTTFYERLAYRRVRVFGELGSLYERGLCSASSFLQAQSSL